jgi:hypothetical protein
MLVEQQGQPQAQHEFQDRGDDGVENGVEHRQPEHAVVEQEAIVLEADEVASPADARIGEAEPDAEPQRIGEKAQQEHARRQHEQECQRSPAVVQPGQESAWSFGLRCGTQAACLISSCG